MDTPVDAKPSSNRLTTTADATNSPALPLIDAHFADPHRVRLLVELLLPLWELVWGPGRRQTALDVRCNRTLHGVPDRSFASAANAAALEPDR